MERSFSVRESIVVGWQALLNNISLFGVAWIIMSSVSLLNVALQMTQLSPAVIFLASLFIAAVSWILYVGLIHIVLECHDKGTSSIGQLWSHADKFPSFLAATIICMLPMISLMTFGSMIVLALGKSPLLFLGFLYVSPFGWLILSVFGVLVMRGSMYMFIIPDKGEGPIEAIRHSWQITQGNTMRLVAFALMAIAPLLIVQIALVPFARIAPFITSFIITLIYTAYNYSVLISYAHVYRQLSRAPRQEQMPSAYAG